MTSEPLDVLVIGAGITGAGIARDAAMRGMRTAVIDQADFASGTSGKSSRLIHGGLRYLEMGHLGLVFEASAERKILLRIAPHLVRPRSFIFPVYRDSRVPRWKLAAGLWLYDILSLFRNVQRHKMLSKREVMAAEPALRREGLVGGARYYDAQCDDARLTVATIRSAHEYGALVANYVRLVEFDVAAGTIQGARVEDRVTGEQHRIRATVVVNATGPWSDRIRPSDQPALRPTKGAHALVDRERLGINEAITMTSKIDGRVMFVLPWGPWAYIGTTDTDDESDPASVEASGDDLIYLLRSANEMFPGARLQMKDILSSWAGFRPLLRPENPLKPSSVSREHRILEDPDGLVSIVGGKLTTYRKMGAEVVDVVARRLRQTGGASFPRRVPTDSEPLPGGATADIEAVFRELVGDGCPELLARHLVRHYGTESAAVLRIAAASPELAQPITGDHPALRAELILACRREMALTLSDLLIRRTHVFYETPAHAVAEAPELADIVGAELGWSHDDKAAQLEAYLYDVQAMDAHYFELCNRERVPTAGEEEEPAEFLHRLQEREASRRRSGKKNEPPG